jgi:hypothetical protein
VKVSRWIWLKSALFSSKAEQVVDEFCLAKKTKEGCDGMLLLKGFVIGENRWCMGEFLIIDT